MSRDPDPTPTERIADALERIADALEEVALAFDRDGDGDPTVRLQVEVKGGV